jgi:hypothetical protein
MRLKLLGCVILLMYRYKCRPHHLHSRHQPQLCYYRIIHTTKSPRRRTTLSGHTAISHHSYHPPLLNLHHYSVRPHLECFHLIPLPLIMFQIPNLPSLILASFYTVTTWQISLVIAFSCIPFHIELSQVGQPRMVNLLGFGMVFILDFQRGYPYIVVYT